MADTGFVARVVQIKPISGVFHHPSLQVGRFYPLGIGVDSADSDLSASKVAAVVIRHNTFAVAHVGMTLQIGDIFKTAPNVVAALEFLIGGKVGVNEDSAIRVDTERSVSEAEPSFMDILGRYAITGPHRLFIKSVKLKEPLEIQTNGGVMGIKG